MNFRDYFKTNEGVFAVLILGLSFAREHVFVGVDIEAWEKSVSLTAQSLNQETDFLGDGESI